MAYRLVLDENIEHEVLHRLRNYGHDVEHVDFLTALGKRTDDYSIGEFSRDTDRLIVSYDDDFALELEESDFVAVLYVEDATLAASELADAIHNKSRHYPQEESVGSYTSALSGSERRRSPLNTRSVPKPEDGRVTALLDLLGWVVFSHVLQILPRLNVVRERRVDNDRHAQPETAEA